MVEAAQTGKGNQMTVTNRDRAEWAGAALRHFQCATGTDYDDALPDLLCDLHHWCDRENVNFQSALDRAREHYDTESSTTSTTPYMATFNIPAGTAREIFHANSPEEALQLARKFADDPSLTEADLEPIAEGSYGQKTPTAENAVASVPELWIPGYFVNDLLRGVQSGDCEDTNRGGSIWNGLES